MSPNRRAGIAVQKPNIFRSRKNRNSIRPYRSPKARFILRLLSAAGGLAIISVTAMAFTFSDENTQKPFEHDDIRNAEIVMEEGYQTSPDIAQSKADFFIDSSGQLRGWVRRYYTAGNSDIVVCNGERNSQGQYLVLCTQ